MTFVCIDMTNLVFLHKHHDRDTISGLAFLEAADRSTLVDNIERDEFLRTIAHGDLCHLYHNVTGDDFREPNWGDRAFQFRERLREAARSMPMTTALATEVAAQVAAVQDRLHDGERFTYVLGSQIPAQPQELFPLKGPPLAPPQIQAADARAEVSLREHKAHLEAERNGEFLPASMRQGGAGAATPDGAAPAAQTDPAPAAQHVTKVRAGSVQPVVFAAAKEAWEARAAGTTWDDIRKQLFTKLTEDGHHPTTVRIKLSKWAKENGI